MSADMQQGAALGEYLWDQHFAMRAKNLSLSDSGPDALLGLYVAAIGRALGGISRDYGIDEARRTVEMALLAIDAEDPQQLAPVKTQ